MAVGACVKATAFSVEGIGGSILRFCLSGIGSKRFI